MLFLNLQKAKTRCHPIAIFASIFLLANFSLSSVSHAGLLETCWYLLSQHQPALTTEEIARALNKKDATVYVSSRIKGSHGGKRLEVRKKGEFAGIGGRWLQKNSHLLETPQGDVTWNHRTLGAQAGSFFGFHVISPWKVTVPDLAEVNGAIEAYNALLPIDSSDRILARFYEEPNLHAPIEKYLTRFAQNLELPLASEHLYFFHDLNFHFLGTILIPHEILKSAQKQTQALLHFAAYLRSRAALGFLSSAEVEDYLTLLFKRRAREIDFATAGYTQFFKDATTLADAIPYGHSDHFVDLGRYKAKLVAYITSHGMFYSSWISVQKYLLSALQFTPVPEKLKPATTDFFIIESREPTFNEDLIPPLTIPKLLDSDSLWSRLKTMKQRLSQK